MTQHR